MSRKRDALIGAAAALLLILLVTLALSGYRLTEIDRNTGRVRTSVYYFCCIRTSQETNDTDFSRLVAQHGLGKQPPDWKPALRVSFGLFSYHGRICYTYNGVWAYARNFGDWVKEYQPSPDMQKQAVAEVMGYMQRDDPAAARDRMYDTWCEWLKMAETKTEKGTF